MCVTMVTNAFRPFGDHLSGKMTRKEPDVSFQSWLRGQVERLEREISGSAIFDSAASCSRDELQQIKRLVVIRSFLDQQLRRMENRRLSRIDRRTAGSRPQKMLTSA